MVVLLCKLKLVFVLFLLYLNYNRIKENIDCLRGCSLYLDSELLLDVGLISRCLIYLYIYCGK